MRNVFWNEQAAVVGETFEDYFFEGELVICISA